MQRRPPKMRTGSPHDPAIPLPGRFSWPEGADGSEDVVGRSLQWSRGADAAVGRAVGPGQRVGRRDLESPLWAQKLLCGAQRPPQPDTPFMELLLCAGRLWPAVAPRPPVGR